MNKWRQYRQIERGEFFLIGGDCSQGGKDFNACQFMSKTKLDIPLVYHSRGVAAQMTREIFPIIEKIFDITEIKPMVALETANGGASEMDTLNVLNRLSKYSLFKMPSIGKTESPESKILGYVTSGGTRPILVGDGKNSIDGKIVRIYDKPTIKEMYAFIINKQGKPEAEIGANDDLVMSFNIVWQLYQICKTPDTKLQPAMRIMSPNLDPYSTYV